MYVLLNIFQCVYLIQNFLQSNKIFSNVWNKYILFLRNVYRIFLRKENPVAELNIKDTHIVNGVDFKTQVYL